MCWDSCSRSLKGEELSHDQTSTRRGSVRGGFDNPCVRGRAGPRKLRRPRPAASDRRERGRIRREPGSARHADARSTRLHSTSSGEQRPEGPQPRGPGRERCTRARRSAPDSDEPKRDALTAVHVRGPTERGQLPPPESPRQSAGPGWRRRPAQLRRDGQPDLRRLLEERGAAVRARSHRDALAGLQRS